MQSEPRPPSSELAPRDPLDPPSGLDLPDLTLPEGLPDAESFEECLELTEAYTEAVVLAFTGDTDGRAPELFAQLRAAAPEDVQDDLAVLEELVAEAAEGGLLDAAGTALSEEFNTANEAVVSWLTTSCSGEGA